jgi:hypothetical protein
LACRTGILSALKTIFPDPIKHAYEELFISGIAEATMTALMHSKGMSDERAL